MLIRNKKANDVNFEIKIGNKKLETLGKIKYPGVTIDSKLKLNDHIENMQKKDR